MSISARVAGQVGFLDPRTWLGGAYLMVAAVAPMTIMTAAVALLLPWLAVTPLALVTSRLTWAASLLDRAHAWLSGGRRPPAGHGPVGRRQARLRGTVGQVTTWWAPVLRAARATAMIDRRMADAVLGNPAQPAAGKPGRDLTAILLLLPLTALTAVAALVSGLSVLILVTIPLWAGPHEQLAFGFLGTVPVGSVPDRAACLGIGLALAVMIAPPLRRAGEVRARLALRLLTVPEPDLEIADLTTRMETLRQVHSAAVRVNAADHRRIERDLHDGAQVTLTALIMDLGRARRKLDSDPAAAHGLVEDAYLHAQHALAEIRDLALGIQPPILADRGLDAAISALTAYAPLPVDVPIRAPERLPAAIESAVYFIAAEAISNITKHANAEHASVRVDQCGGPCILEITDDGDGGASLTPGGGLAGLADRALALGGSLTLSSPPGGPTTLRAELPCTW